MREAGGGFDAILIAIRAVVISSEALDLYCSTEISTYALF